jgi:hypothetical protein
MVESVTMEALTLKCTALVAIPLGLILFIAGVVGSVTDDDAFGWPFWAGTVLFAVGVLAAVASAWWKNSHR